MHCFGSNHFPFTLTKAALDIHCIYDILTTLLIFFSRMLNLCFLSFSSVNLVTDSMHLYCRIATRKKGNNIDLCIFSLSYSWFWLPFTFVLSYTNYILDILVFSLYLLWFSVVVAQTYTKLQPIRLLEHVLFKDPAIFLHY